MILANMCLTCNSYSISVSWTVRKGLHHELKNEIKMRKNDICLNIMMCVAKSGNVKVCKQVNILL